MYVSTGKIKGNKNQVTVTINNIGGLHNRKEKQAGMGVSYTLQM
jgi:hypothetical protein